MASDLPALSLRNLQKTYASGKQALKGITLDIPQGSMFALLGPNGAGKSTLINILAGLVTKTGGTANVWGFDIDVNPRNAKMSIGVVPQELVFDAFFTPREVLEMQAGLYGVRPADRRTDEILKAVHLEAQADSYARTLSGGMKRRLLVAKALVHGPPILILDEPTAGVDVELRQQLWAYVRSLHASGVTVVLTTHYLEEAQELCDRVAIINHGQLIANTDTKSLLAQSTDRRVLLTLDRDVAIAPSLPTALTVELRGQRRLLIQFDRQLTDVGRLLSDLASHGLGITDLTTQEPDLEDVFLALTASTPPSA